MMCSRDVKTTFPIATMPSCLTASRMTANAWRPTLPSGTMYVRIVEIQLVDLLAGYKLVDFDRPLTLNCYGFKLFRLNLDVLALADFVAFDDVRGFHFIFVAGINLTIFDPTAGLLVDLMETDLLPLAARRIKGDGTRYQ